MFAVCLTGELAGTGWDDDDDDEKGQSNWSRNLASLGKYTSRQEPGGGEATHAQPGGGGGEATRAQPGEGGGARLLMLSPHRWNVLFFSLALVVLTSLAGYTMAPAPLQMGTLLWATSGTALCSAAANTINQVGGTILHHRAVCKDRSGRLFLPVNMFT